MFDEKVLNGKVKEAAVTKTSKIIFTLLLLQHRLTGKAGVINPWISEGFRILTI
jgi:hypothetical protein